MIYAVILFAATYVLMLALQKYRTYVALASALCFIVSGMLPLDKIVGSIDFNVLLMKEEKKLYFIGKMKSFA